MRPNYQAHERFVNPARHSAEVLRLIIGVILTLVGTFLLVFLVSLAVRRIGLQLPIADPDSPLGNILMLGSFVFLATATLLTVDLLHLRSPRTLLGPVPLAVRQALRVGLWLSGLIAVIWILPPSELPETGVRTRSMADWLPWIPFALLALLIQTSTEEIVFRGYLQQQLAARFAQPWVWICLPSVLFGLLHFRTDAEANAWLIVAAATAFGLAAADLTARSGTLGPAIAMHFVINTTAILGVSYDASISGLALFFAPVDIADPAVMVPMMALDFLFIGVCWLTARLALRR